MKRTHLLLAIPCSLYSKDFYREVAKSWIGRSFVYLFVLLAICWIATTLVSVHGLWRVAEFTAQDLSRQLPVIYIHAGVASTESVEPTFIRWTTNQKLAKTLKTNLFAIIDTHDQVKNFQKSSAAVLVRSKTIYVKHQGKPIVKYHFSKKLNTTFGPKQLIQKLQGAKSWFYVFGTCIIYSIGLVLSYCKYIILGLVYALIGLLFNAGLKRKLNYGNLLGIALVSVTPTILLKTVLFAFQIFFPFEILVYYLLPLAYVYFGIRAAE